MLLKHKSVSKTKTLTIRIPGDLAAQIDEVRKLADDAGLVFDVAEVCTKSLQIAVKQARAELQK